MLVAPILLCLMAVQGGRAAAQQGDSAPLAEVSGTFRGRSTSKYKSNGQMMTLVAQSPQGAHQGIVGTWSTSFSSDVLDAGGAVVH